jgi:AcrR family transcriptional regulator
VPNSRISDERQEAILAAAQSLIAAKGVDAVSMADLAKATGLSRPAIYQYFASKDHVLAELVINEMADLSNAIERHIEGLKDPMERIRIWVHYSLAHLASAEHRIIREISIASLPEESRGMINAMHGHFMTALLSPVREIGIRDVTATAHLIFASVAAAAKRIDEGSEFVREAAALEQFTIAGLMVTSGLAEPIQSNVNPTRR